MDKSATPEHDPLAQPAVNSADKSTPTAPPPRAPVPAAPPAPGPEETPPEVPLTPMAWLAQNAIYLIMVAALVIWIVSNFGWEGLPSAGLTILGIGFIIFIHELGHFLVAKWCDVHVLTFSIGFGPALPGCSFKRGETTYKLSLLPLGGYVNMVGEGTDADESEDYPRSFKNKSVGQRMAIISAGVIMNVIFGVVCFIFVFRTHGVERTVANVGVVDPGSPAWIEGVRSGWQIVRIGDNDRPSFEDLRQKVALAGTGEEIPFEFVDPYHDNKEIERQLQPKRGASNMNPVIGVGSLSRLQLPSRREGKVLKVPFRLGSPAAAARVLNLGPGDRVLKMTDPEKGGRVTALQNEPAQGKRWYDDLSRRLMALSGKEGKVVVLRNGEEDKERPLSDTGFDFGDVVVGMTDPKSAGDGDKYDPFKVKKLERDPRSNGDEFRDPIEFRLRLKELAGKPVVIQVRREDAADSRPPDNLFVPPAFHSVLGVRMAMGKVAALRKGSPAEEAGLKPRNLEDNEPGDTIQAVLMTGKGGQLLFAAGKTLPVLDRFLPPLDPARLPVQLAAAARHHGGRKWVTVIVPRPDSHQETGHALPPMKWDAEWDDVSEALLYATSPLSIPQLGIAYWVDSRLEEVEPNSPAARARRVEEVDRFRWRFPWEGFPPPLAKDHVYELVPDSLKPGDVISRIRFFEGLPGEPKRWGSWHELKTKRGTEEVYERWASAFLSMQGRSGHVIQFGIRRDGEEIKEPFEVILDEDLSWPLEGQDRGLILMPDVHMERAEGMGEALQYGVQETKRWLTGIYLGLYRLIKRQVSVENLGGPIEIVSTTFTLASDDVYKLLLFLAMLSINLAVVNFLPIPLLDGGHMVFLIYEKLRGKPASEQVRAIAAYIGLAMLLTLMVTVFYLDGHRRGWW